MDIMGNGWYLSPPGMQEDAGMQGFVGRDGSASLIHYPIYLGSFGPDYGLAASIFNALYVLFAH